GSYLPRLITRVPKSEIHNPKSCLPEAGQSQLETWQHRIACYRFRMLQTLRRVTRPIHIHPVINGIDEPAEPSAVGDVLFQLHLKLAQSVSFRSELDDEVRTNRCKDILFSGRQRIPSLAVNPRCIRRTLGSVG